MGALWKAPFREKSCLMGKRLSLPASQSTQGAFHLSELTGQPIPIVMRIVLINNNHPDQSNQGDGFSAKPLGKRLFYFQNAWSGLRKVPLGYVYTIPWWLSRGATKSYPSYCEHLSDISRSTLEISAAQLRPVTEIAPQPFLCVNRSPIDPVWFSWRPV